MAVVTGTANAINGKATIGIPNPIVPLISPPAITANIITITTIGSLYIVNLKKLWH